MLKIETTEIRYYMGAKVAASLNFGFICARSWAFRMLYPPFFSFRTPVKGIIFASFRSQQQFVYASVFSPHCSVGDFVVLTVSIDFSHLAPLFCSSFVSSAL